MTECFKRPCSKLEHSAANDTKSKYTTQTEERNYTKANNTTALVDGKAKKFLVSFHRQVRNVCTHKVTFIQNKEFVPQQICMIEINKDDPEPMLLLVHQSLHVVPAKRHEITNSAGYLHTHTQSW